MARRPAVVAEIPAEIPVIESPEVVAEVEAEVEAPAVRKPGRVSGSETPEEIEARTAKARRTTRLRGVLDRLCAPPAVEAPVEGEAAPTSRHTKNAAALAEIENVLAAGVKVDKAGRNHVLTATATLNLLQEKARLTKKLASKAAVKAMPDSREEQLEAVVHALENGKSPDLLLQIGVPEAFLVEALASMRPAAE